MMQVLATLRGFLDGGGLLKVERVAIHLLDGLVQAPWQFTRERLATHEAPAFKAVTLRLLTI